MEDPSHFVILYVDDEPANLVSLEYALESRFKVLLAQTGKEALAVLRERPVAVLLADQRMPGMSGVELCERACEASPDTVRMIATAYADLQVAIDAINRGHVERFVPKPWVLAEMVDTLQAAVGVYQLRKATRETGANLLRSEKAAGGLAMAAKVHHQLVQKMQILRIGLRRASSLARKVSEPTIGRELETILAGGETAIDLAIRLLEGARRGDIARSDEPLDCDVSSVMGVAMRMLRPEIETRARVDFVAQDALRVPYGPTELAQVFLNLLANAREALPEGDPAGQRVEVRVERRLDQCMVTISDTGRGIAADRLTTVFDSDYSTSGRDGAGLGLAIVKEIVERRGGRVEAERGVERGSTFRLRLPVLTRIG